MFKKIRNQIGNGFIDFGRGLTSNTTPQDEVKIAVIGSSGSGKTHVLYDLINTFRSTFNIINGHSNLNGGMYTHIGCVDFLKNASKDLSAKRWIAETKLTDRVIYTFLKNHKSKNGMDKDGCFMNISGEFFTIDETSASFILWTDIFDLFNKEKVNSDWVTTKNYIYTENVSLNSSHPEFLEKTRNLLNLKVALFLYEATDVIFCWDSENPLKDKIVYDNLSIVTSGAKKNKINILTKVDKLFKNELKWNSTVDVSSNLLSKILTEKNPRRSYIDNVVELYSDFYKALFTNEPTQVFQIEKNHKVLKINQFGDTFYEIDPFKLSSQRPYKKFYISLFPYDINNDKVFEYDNSNVPDDFFGNRNGIGSYEIIYDIINYHKCSRIIKKEELDNDFKRLTNVY